MVACAPTLGPLIAALVGRVSTKRAASGKYPSHPERHQQFSNISDSEYPLQPMYGIYAKADSKKGNSASALKGTSQMRNLDPELRSGDLD